MLFESIPRRNTNELAHRLTDNRRTNNRLSDNRVDPEKGRDGTGALPALLKENPRSLAKTRGIGSASARLISSVLSRTAERMSTALCGRSLPALCALLPAADLRLNGMGEAGAVLLFDADGLLTDWLPARDIKTLLRLSEKARARRVPSWLVLIRKDAADRLRLDEREREPDLSARFPGAAKIGVLTPDHRIEWQ